MKSTTHNVLAACLSLVVATAAMAFGDSVTIRMKTGSTWRGEVNDMVEVTYTQSGRPIQMTGRLIKAAELYVIIEGELAGEVRKKTIFRNDLRSMKSLGDDSDAAESLANAPRRSGRTDSVGATGDATNAEARKGVFVLPMEGMVGGPFRHEEIDMIGEEADKYGRGQIIVLKIKSNGGLVLESEMIAESIMDLKKRHRVVAWIDKAISAGCMTAMCCDEIYFMTHGSAGSVTTLAGGRSLPEEMVRDHVVHFAKLAEDSGYSPHIARAMKFNHYMCSYDKDEETGEVTFYGDLSGKYILSDAESNLSFNASNALHCGFSKGTADTEADLAKRLNLPKYYEPSRYGYEIAEDWQNTHKKADEEIDRLLIRLNYWKTGSGDPIEILGGQIQIITKLIRWWDRCEEAAMFKLPEKWTLERQLKELKRQLGQMKAAQRGG